MTMRVRWFVLLPWPLLLIVGFFYVVGAFIIAPFWLIYVVVKAIHDQRVDDEAVGELVLERRARGLPDMPTAAEFGISQAEYEARGFNLTLEELFRR